MVIFHRHVNVYQRVIQPTRYMLYHLDRIILGVYHPTMMQTGGKIGCLKSSFLARMYNIEKHTVLTGDCAISYSGKGSQRVWGSNLEIVT